MHLNIDMTHFSDFLTGLWFSTRQYWYKVVKISVCMRIFTLGDKISLTVTKFHSQWQKFISYLNYMYWDLLYTTYIVYWPLIQKKSALKSFSCRNCCFFIFRKTYKCLCSRSILSRIRSISAVKNSLGQKISIYK